jgi:hypothetical protein
MYGVTQWHSSVVARPASAIHGETCGLWPPDAPVPPLVGVAELSPGEVGKHSAVTSTTTMPMEPALVRYCHTGAETLTRSAEALTALSLGALPSRWLICPAEPCGGVESLRSMNPQRSRVAMLTAVALITGLVIGNLGEQTAAATRVLGHIARPAAPWAGVSTFPQASGGFGELCFANLRCGGFRVGDVPRREP